MYIVAKKYQNGQITAAPTPVIHPTLFDAETEAMRLAETNNYVFVVFEAVSEAFSERSPVTLRTLREKSDA